MRIALCSDTYHPIPDGVSRHLVDYKAELERRGHTVRVYTVFSDNDGVFGLPSFKFPLYPEYKFAIPVYEMYRDLERFKPDVVHIHTPFVLGTMGYRYAKKRGIPVIGTYHTDFVNMDKTLDFPFIKSVLNIGFQYNMHLYRKLDLVISPSELVAKHLRSYGNDSKVIHVGIDLSRFIYKEQKSNFYLFIGRLTSDKGIPSLLEVASKMPEIKFKIAGVGPLRWMVEKYSEKFPNIEYLGFVSEERKIELMSNAKVLVIPSRAETFGVVYIEGMASGTPIIASTESREIGILREGYNGWFVRFGDTEGLIRKITEINSKDLIDFNRRAKESSKSFSIQATTDALESTYGEMIESQKK
jgi:glycosyltransferase involved in cell wall biosynthesis